MTECISFLLTAQMLFIEASEHHNDGRVISEQMELQRASFFMRQYRRCLKENKMTRSNLEKRDWIGE